MMACALSAAGGGPVHKKKTASKVAARKLRPVQTRDRIRNRG